MLSAAEQLTARMGALRPAIRELGALMTSRAREDKAIVEGLRTARNELGTVSGRLGMSDPKFGLVLAENRADLVTDSLECITQGGTETSLTTILARFDELEGMARARGTTGLADAIRGAREHLNVVVGELSEVSGRLRKREFAAMGMDQPLLTDMRTQGRGTATVADMFDAELRAPEVVNQALAQKVDELNVHRIRDHVEDVRTRLQKMLADASRIDSGSAVPARP